MAFAFRVIDLWNTRVTQAVRRHPRGFPATVLRHSREKSYSWHGRWIANATIARRFLLVGAIRQYSPATFPQARQRAVLAFVAVWATLSVVLLAGHHLVFIPVRFQVTALFAVAAGATLAALIGFADSYRQS